MVKVEQQGRGLTTSSLKHPCQLLQPCFHPSFVLSFKKVPLRKYTKELYSCWQRRQMFSTRGPQSFILALLILSLFLAISRLSSIAVFLGQIPPAVAPALISSPGPARQTSETSAWLSLTWPCLPHPPSPNHSPHFSPPRAL